MRRALTWTVAALAAILCTPTRAAEVSQDLDSYSLFAASSLRAKRLRVVSGDVGVSAGSLSVSSFQAAESQVIANDVRVGRSTCRRLFSNRAKGTSASCGPATKFSGPIVADLGAACGFPSPFPSCNPAAKEVLSKGKHRAHGAAPTVLAPGVYGDLVVKAGQTVVLAGGGRYVFCDVAVSRGGGVEVRGAADVLVDGKLRATGISLAAAAVTEAAAPADVRFFVAGGAAALGGRVATGHFCAPSAKLGVKNGDLTGHFAAKSIALTGTVVAIPPSWWRRAASRRRAAA